jgi:hypothetical protein
MKQMRLISYAGLLILLLGIIFFGLRYQAALFSASRHEISGIFAYYQFKAAFPLLIGILLAIPHFINQFAQTGKWKVNWVSLIVIGLPFLYLSVVPLLYVFDLVNINIPFSDYALGGYFGSGASTTFEVINGIIAGFIVSTSIVKSK